MVVPYKQAPDLNGLTDEELPDLMKLTRRCQNALTQVMKPDGFNIGINLGKVAGAGIAGPFAHPRRPALAGRHELHAGAGQHGRACRKPCAKCAAQTPRRPLANTLNDY